MDDKDEIVSRMIEASRRVCNRGGIVDLGTYHFLLKNLLELPTDEERLKFLENQLEGRLRDETK